jgi:hypothetical protein
LGVINREPATVSISSAPLELYEQQACAATPIGALASAAPVELENGDHLGLTPPSRAVR